MVHLIAIYTAATTQQALDAVYQTTTAPPTGASTAPTTGLSTACQDALTTLSANNASCIYSNSK